MYVMYVYDKIFFGKIDLYFLQFVTFTDYSLWKMSSRVGELSIHL